MDPSVIEELGLSKSESAAYLALARLGETKVGKIIEKSGLVSSAVHNALNALGEKGFVTHVMKGKIKHYRAAPAEQLLDFMDEKRRRLREALPQLKRLQQFAHDPQEAEVFEGKNGIHAMLNRLMEGSSKGDEWLFFAVDVAQWNEEIQEFFHAWDARREAAGLKVRGLVPARMRKHFRGRESLAIRYPKFPIPTNISVCNDKVGIVSWGELPVGFLIRSQQIAGIHRAYFNETWSLC